MIKVSEKHIGIFAVMVYFISQYISDVMPAGQLLILVSLALLMYLILNHRGLKIRKQLSTYIIYMYGFALFCAASILWAENPSLAVSKVNSVFIAVIGMTVIYSYSFNRFKVDDILTIIMYGGYISVFIISLRYGWSGIRSILSEQQRMTSDVINSNTLGMCTAYALVINVYYIFYGRRRISDILIVPAVLMIAASGSRKAFLIMVGGIFALLLLKSFDNKNIRKLLLRGFLIVLFIIILLFFITRLNIFSNVLNRMDDIFEYLKGNATRYNNSVWLRFAYARLGWKIFISHPIFGIGLGNASIYTMQFYGTAHYLHNNYVEILACAGIVGFLVHYWLYFYLLWVYIKNFRHHNEEFSICFILLVFKLIMDLGAVSYYTKPTYFYLLLFVIGAQRIKMEKDSRQLDTAAYSLDNTDEVKGNAYQYKNHKEVFLG